ncbi:hypothetical protein K504DRAFT_501599 [Pleomassaria siparia CBS 279.74]|uniref:Uncharacterized protein n=1 Tax=Pleomassaria siparia CBS 279.74 TaxID=1314801 RepID=A0A6G1KBY7_9PLEO|nr:hypothetical protein K504DRAFT_501599 [Pleomassaria siparia CBS 279.74]
MNAVTRWIAKQYCRRRSYPTTISTDPSIDSYGRGGTVKENDEDVEYYSGRPLPQPAQGHHTTSFSAQRKVYDENTINTTYPSIRPRPRSNPRPDTTPSEGLKRIAVDVRITRHIDMDNGEVGRILVKHKMEEIEAENEQLYKKIKSNIKDGNLLVRRNHPLLADDEFQVPQKDMLDEPAHETSPPKPCHATEVTETEDMVTEAQTDLPSGSPPPSVALDSQPDVQRCSTFPVPSFLTQGFREIPALVVPTVAQLAQHNPLENKDDGQGTAEALVFDI